MPKSLYNTRYWKRIRKSVLKRDALCVKCLANGKLVPSQHIDHIENWKQTGKFYVSMSQLQGICHSCHSRKTNFERLKDKTKDKTKEYWF